MSNYSIKDLRIAPGEGEATASDMVIIARSNMLGGDFSIMHGEVRSRHLLVNHTHENEDQAVFLLAGELEFEVGGRNGLRFSAKAGDWVLKPRGIQHGFWNMNEETARYIELSGRDGFERFVDARRDGIRAMTAKGEEVGMTFHYDRIPELMLKHRLTGLSGVNVEAPSFKEILAKLPFTPKMS